MNVVRRSASRDWLTNGAWLLLMVLLITGGYLGFRALVSQPDWRILNLYLLAIAAGTASFFSPCAFPLLPAYLSFYHQAQSELSTPYRAFTLGLAAAFGMMTFVLLLGSAIGFLGIAAAKGLSITQADPNRFVLLWRAALGGLLVALGVGQLLGWSFKPRAADALAYRTRPKRGQHARPYAILYLYGFGYTAAGIGCIGPILAGLTVMVFSAGGFAAALVAFGLFALTMMILMLLVSGLVAASQQSILNRLKAGTPKIKTASAVLLIGIGLFNLITVVRLSTFIRVLFP